MGNLGESHPTDVLFAERFEEALGGGHEFLGDVPLLFAKAGETLRPIGGVLPFSFGEALSLALEEAGVEGVDAFGPIISTGPVFDGADGLAQLVGDSLEGAGVAQLQERPEDGIGTRGLAGEAWERVTERGSWPSAAGERWSVVLAASGAGSLFLTVLQFDIMRTSCQPRLDIYGPTVILLTHLLAKLRNAIATALRFGAVAP